MAQADKQEETLEVNSCRFSGDVLDHTILYHAIPDIDHRSRDRKVLHIDRSEEHYGYCRVRLKMRTEFV